MKVKLFTSIVILALFVSEFSTLIIPSHSQRNKFLLNPVSPRKLINTSQKFIQNKSPQLVANKQNNSRELKKASLKQKPYNGFQKTRPLFGKK